MGTSLKSVNQQALGELALVLNLRSEDLQKVKNHRDKVRPTSAWTAKQKILVGRLPRCFQRRPPPRGAFTKVSQIAKRFITAASGGARHVAQRKASGGKALDDRLHPFSTATVFCHVHRKMHPVLMREIFYYLSREVADSADPIRRHPRHDDNHHDSIESDESESDTDPEHHVCKSKTVRDWGHRMFGLSALWCDSQTFRALELGFLTAAARRSHKNQGDHRHHGIHRVDRMPQLDCSCEACILAAICSRPQALVDLRAGLLSRMAHAAKEEERRKQLKDKKGKRRANRTKSTRPAHIPRLWKVVEAFIDACDGVVADAIRKNSETLADDLYIVRQCEARRQRQLEYQQRMRRNARHRRPHGRNEPPRMVTKNGHRQPLPLLPDSLDPWTTGHTGQTQTTQTGHDQPHRPHRHRTHRTHRTRRTDGQETSHRQQREQRDDGRGREPSTYANPEDGMYCGQGEMNGTEATEAAAGTDVPTWEGNYLHAIYDYASVAPDPYGMSTQSIYGMPGHANGSFLTATVRTTSTPTMRRRTSRIPVRKLGASVPETMSEAMLETTTPEPRRASPSRVSRPISHVPIPQSTASSSTHTASNSVRATPSRLSRPIPHIPLPRSTASSSTHTASNGVRASPQSRAQSTARSTSPSVITPPRNPPKQPSQRPARPDNNRQSRPPRPRTPPPPPPPPPLRTHTSTTQPTRTRRSPYDITSYIAAQTEMAEDYRRTRVPSARLTPSPGAMPLGSAAAQQQQPPPASSFYSADDENRLPWWAMQRPSSVEPEDSVSCVMMGQWDEQAEQAQLQWRERQKKLQKELQRQQVQRDQALEQLTGTYGNDQHDRQSQQSTLPPYLSHMAPEAPSAVPSPLQVRRLPPPQPVPPHLQPQPVRLSPWTRLQTQMHCRPLPPQSQRTTGSSTVTRWPGPCMYDC